MRTIEQVDAWMRDPAHRNRWQGGTWHNRCEQFINNAGGFGQGFATAKAAGDASGWLNPNPATAPDGAIGYWGGVWIGGIECGHDAFFYRGRLLMASDAVTENMGGGTGTISFADYARRRPAAKWRGWSMRHGTQTLAASGTAGGGTTPLPLPLPIGKALMYLVWTTDAPNLPASRCWLLTPEGFRQITDTTSAELKLWKRAGIPEMDSAKPILVAELDILAAFLRTGARGYVDPAAALAAAIVKLLPESSGGPGLTKADVTAAVTAGVQAVKFTGTITAKE